MKQLFGTTLTHKLLAAGAFALLAGGAAVGAFASQDKLPGRADTAAVTQIDATATSTDTVTATATGTETGTSTTTATATATGTTTPTVEPEDARHGDCTTTTTVTATATDTATATPTSTATAVAGGQNDGEQDDQGDNNQGENGNQNHDCDIKGIPSTNPNHQPEATPGVCNKGETVIKTTPSGEQVNVPCHADKGNGNNGDGQDPAGAQKGGHD
jgi:hypothetical protein